MINDRGWVQRPDLTGKLPADATEAQAAVLILGPGRKWW